MNKLIFKILTILDRCQEPIPSGHIARRLSLQGFDLSERTVRHHLKMLDQKGYTEHRKKRGRRITEKGRQELSNSFVCERVGFIINKINNLSFLTDFNPRTLLGKVILNVTYVREETAAKALSVMSAVLHSPYAFSNRVIIKKGGECIGDLTVPGGMVGIGTVCSITLNGILLKERIPAESKFGGIVSVKKNIPRNFTSFIGYEKSSVAPLEFFLKGKMTNVLKTLVHSDGEVLGSLREIPETCLNDAKRVCKLLSNNAIGGAILLGQPSQPFLGMPVTTGKVGMVILGGLNPLAALGEAGISADSHSMDTICEYDDMVPVEEFVGISCADEHIPRGSARVSCGEMYSSRVPFGKQYQPKDRVFPG